MRRDLKTLFQACSLVMLFVVLCPVFPLSTWVPAQAQELAVVLETLAEELDEPVGVISAGDGRLFVLNKRGLISIWDGEFSDTPYLDIRDRVLYTGESQSELGLLSAAFHPGYASNGFIYVTYVNRDGHSTISRFEVSGDPNRALAGSERILLIVEQPGKNHNVNHLQFGPDGYLYLASGEGGFLREPRCSGQERDHLLGKLLRLDVDQNIDTPPYHAIPSDNPFVDRPDTRDEIWALGLRNPWRFSFDRTTGDLFIADVGQSLREEINREPASSPGGHNYGFKMMEGNACRGSFENCDMPVPPCGDPAYTVPIFDYPHDDSHCAVIGGYVYRGSQMPRLFGQYLFGDFCGALGAIRSTEAGWTHQPLLPDLPGMVAFGEEANGELVAIVGTTLHRLTGALEVSSIAFASSAFETSESAGAAIIVLERRGGIEGSVTVEVTSRDDTATEGSDYEAVETRVTWEDGDAENKRIMIPILQDALIEGAESLIIEVEIVEGIGAVGAPSEARLHLIDDDIQDGPCVADATTLCLNNDRFLVQTRWRTSDPETGDQRTGLGQAQELTDETGTFWFFNPENLEVIVKVLRGCFDPFQHYWVFAGGLTDVEVEMTVVDTATGLIRRYDNPLGQPFLPIQDTQAFDSCP